MEVRGISQRGLSVRAGLVPSHVNRLLAGSGRPTAGTLERLADALGVDFEWLATGHGTAPPELSALRPDVAAPRASPPGATPKPLPRHHDLRLAPVSSPLGGPIGEEDTSLLSAVRRAVLGMGRALQDEAAMAAVGAETAHAFRVLPSRGADAADAADAGSSQTHLALETDESEWWFGEDSGDSRVLIVRPPKVLSDRAARAELQIVPTTGQRRSVQPASLAPLTFALRWQDLTEMLAAGGKLLLGREEKHGI